MTDQDLLGRQKWATRLVALVSIAAIAVGFVASSYRENAIRAEGRAAAYREAISMSINAVVVVAIDQGDTVTDWSHGAAEMFGYSREEMIGQSIETIIPLEMRAKHREALHKAMRRDSSDPLKYQVQIVRCEGLTKDGDRIPVMITTRCIRDGGGSAAAFIATVDRLSSVREITIPPEEIEPNG